MFGPQEQKMMPRHAMAESQIFAVWRGAARLLQFNASQNLFLKVGAKKRLTSSVCRTAPRLVQFGLNFGKAWTGPWEHHANTSHWTCGADMDLSFVVWAGMMHSPPFGTMISHRPATSMSHSEPRGETPHDRGHLARCVGCFGRPGGASGKLPAPVE